MRPWLSRTLLVAGSFAACWAGAVWYWRATRRMPGGDDLALYLLVLPLSLLLLLWGGRLLLAALGAAPAAARAAAAAEAPAAAPSAPPVATLSVLAGALRMPHGDNARELADAMLARQARLALDPELQDEHGYPILSGRVADLDPLALQDSMADWLGGHQPAADFNEEQWRALALGSAVAGELAAELGPHRALPAYLDAVAAGRTAPPLPTLQLFVLLPPDWTEVQRHSAAAWLRHVVARHGWPEARLAPPLLGAAGQAPLVLIGQLAGQAAQNEENGQPLLCLLLACASHIGAASVRDWGDQAMLFDSKRPDGRIPGEGAAGLLLADAGQAAMFDHAQAALLYPASGALRARSADAGGRGDTAQLAQLAQQCMAAAGVDAAQVGLLAADSDQRPSRMAELLGTAATVLPDLDVAGQVFGVAACCGDAGAVSAVAALVLARQQVGAGAGHVLCLSNLDPFQRGAVVLGPPAAAPAASAA